MMCCLARSCGERGGGPGLGGGGETFGRAERRGQETRAERDQSPRDGSAKLPGTGKGHGYDVWQSNRSTHRGAAFGSARPNFFGATRQGSNTNLRECHVQSRTS